MFCVGRLNRGCYLYTNSVTPTAAGASFGGDGMHRIWGCGGGQPPQNVSGSSILPTPDSEEPKKKEKNRAINLSCTVTADAIIFSFQTGWVLFMKPVD